MWASGNDHAGRCATFEPTDDQKVGKVAF